MTYFKVKGGANAFRQKPTGTKTPNQEKTGLIFGCNTVVPTNTSSNIDIVTIKKQPTRRTNGGGAVTVQKNDRYLKTAKK